MTCGIYKLNFKGTNKVYIGKGVRIEHRLSNHRKKFIDGTHSRKMNAAYAEFGMPTIEVLCECLKSELNELENEAIEIFNAVDNGFNTLYKAEDSPGNFLFGELGGTSKHSNKQALDVFNYLTETKLTAKVISELTGASIHMVRSMSAGASYRWLEGEYPEKYLILMQRKSGWQNIKGTNYTILSPQKESFIITGSIRSFAAQYGLDPSDLRKVLLGKNKSTKGWKVP